MRNFNRDGGGRGSRRGGFGGRKSFGGDRGFGRRDRYDGGDRGDRQMYQAICSNCGRECEVPFRPTGDKPVYCNDCFEKLGKREDRGSYDRPRFDKRNSSGDASKAQLDAINAKLDKILSMLQPKQSGEVFSQPEVPTEVPVETVVTKLKRLKKASQEAAPEVPEAS